MEQNGAVQDARRTDRYLVSVGQYRQYHRDGFLKADGLLKEQDTRELFEFAERMRLQNESQKGAADPASRDPLKAEFAERTRVHMLSRIEPEAERGMLHPHILDVIQALIGPDVYALQSMLFFNPPGRGGQGWHQDSYYISTQPDSLIGAWIALEDADEENGCLWVVPGSNHEPVYPPGDSAQRTAKAKETFRDLQGVYNVSHLDDEVNTLSKVVANYPDPIPVPMKAGDVLFFHSHLFHRSYPNRTADRFRRSYVCHYCNARSWVPWDHDGYEGSSGNYRQILARGSTHMPFAKPVFGTEVIVSEPGESAGSVRMMGMDNGMMMPVTDGNGS
ncbi:phytanoyl-CoA dioxygenase family protein [Paenibacillus humicola]|uniref:phytanoyl-CoA dioxygenase family protein n=1 Tax=Paenibacillus humicola TaxID=3110540 RepID=UPI00237B891E|nr:phytanoyl-CoA dioxygenase family protein [Paenibacillus humicola]